MLGKKVGLDIGTSMTRITVKGEGMAGSEPTVVAIRGGAVPASLIGVAALEAAAGDPEWRLHHPVVGGAVVDAAAVRALISHAMNRATGRQRIFKPDVVVAVMSALPGHQRRLLLEAAATAGARTVYLLDAPLAAAMGAGIRLGGQNGHLVVDVGAGKTEVAVLAMEGTVSSRCLPGHGGRRLTSCIAGHVRSQHGVLLDQVSAEELVASLARVGQHEERRLQVAGRGDAGEVRVTVTSTELGACLESHVRPILDAVAEVVADTPAALLADIRREGMVLCGGGARLEGLDRALAAASGFEVHRDTQPHLCAVRGTGYALDNLDVLRRTLMYIR